MTSKGCPSFSFLCILFHYTRINNTISVGIFFFLSHSHQIVEIRLHFQKSKIRYLKMNAILPKQ